ncbi:MAG: hypothetical protein R3Y24_13145 [Eubacteriales bacterium]
MVCKNCGAKFNRKEPKCPFCGYFNYVGAAEQYKGKLDDLQDDLEDLNALPAQEVRKEIKRASGIIFFTIFLIGSLVIGLVSLNAIFEYDEISGKEAKEMKAIMIWEYETYSQMDLLYEAGDYDAILEFEDSLISYDWNYNLYDWKHYEFMDLYDTYAEFLQSKERMVEYGSDYNVGSVIYQMITIQCANPEEYSHIEWEIIETYIEETREYAFEVLLFTENELEELCQEANDDGVVVVDVCYDYSEVVEERISE